MEVTLEQLKAVNPSDLKGTYVSKMLKSTIKYVESKGGKAWVHLDVLADFGITEETMYKGGSYS